MKRVVESVDALIPAQPKALRVCAYARVSTGKDAMLHSLSAQVSYYSKIIQSHNGWMYCGVYSDEAVTGTKREQVGFQHMIEECRQGNIDLVITKSISRFARNTVTLLQTVRELKNFIKNISIIIRINHAVSSTKILRNLTEWIHIS